MNPLSSATILEKLISPLSKDNEEAMAYLYNVLFEKVELHIIRNNGSKSEAKDVFQDALMALFDLVQQNKAQKIENIEAYVYSVCRFIWLNELKKKKRETSEELENLKVPIDAVWPQESIIGDKSELLKKVLKELGEGCETILIAFYLQGQSMEEIVKMMDLSNTQVAKNKKYKCLQRLKKLISNSDYYKNKLR